MNDEKDDENEHTQETCVCVCVCACSSNKEQRVERKTMFSKAFQVKDSSANLLKDTSNLNQVDYHTDYCDAEIFLNRS